MRRVYFSFDFSDLDRATAVRDCWVGSENMARGPFDREAFAELERDGLGAIGRWIEDQLRSVTVTVVLVGNRTCWNRWVDYAIQKSQEHEHGLLGIDVSKMRDANGETTERCGILPVGYDFYRWNSDSGALLLDEWIDRAARAAGKP